MRKKLVMAITSEQALQKGIEAHKAGKVQEADRYYNTILKANPKHPDANHNMGVLAVGAGKVQDALPFFKAALDANPNMAQFWLSYIDALIKLDRLADAKTVLNQAKSNGAKGNGFDKLEELLSSSHSQKSNAQDPLQAQLQSLVNLYNQKKLKQVFEEAQILTKRYTKSLTLWNLMGASAAQIGKLDEAVRAFQEAISLNPKNAWAHNNIGNALRKQNKLDKAIEAYNKALSIKPDLAEAYSSIGNALRKQNKLDKAIEAYNKAISIKPDFAKAFNNMGIALQDQGKLDKAIRAYNKALSIKPDYAEAWNNIFFPLQAIKFQKRSNQNLDALYPKDINSNYGSIKLSILNYKLHRGQKSEGAYLDKALQNISKAQNITIQNPTFVKIPEEAVQDLTGQMVALVHFGRSGTGLMHSLIDGHPEVSTLPGVYFSEYFDHSTWDWLISAGWHGMVDRFVSMYEVLFDATSSIPTPAISNKLLYNIGITDGMANIGDEKNQVLKVDKGLFKTELKRLMAFHNELDTFVFFKLVHLAHDSALKDPNSKSLIFYHIHNPDTYAQLNFARFNPDTKWLVMVREPIQSCESSIREPFRARDYFGVTSRILTMLFEIDNSVYSGENAFGVRLEDLKTKPQKTIPALCKWMGITESESLYEMTAQGKKWWGDPSSPDYSKDGMEPFGKTSIKRKVGSIFSENDQFILRTLFYPFSVRFGYAEENTEQFKADLQKIRPMIDEMFDFEKDIAEQMKMSCKKIIFSVSYLYFRSGMIERWNTLNEFRTYPNMIKLFKI